MTLSVRLALALSLVALAWSALALVMLGVLEAGYTVSTRNVSGYCCVRGTSGTHNYMAFSWPRPLNVETGE